MIKVKGEMVTKKIIVGWLIINFLMWCNIKIVQAETSKESSASIHQIAQTLIRIEENQKSLQRQIDDNYKHLQRQIDDNYKHLQRQIDDNQKSLQQQINNLQQQINELRADMKWGFGIMWMGMFALMGFILWDRRTALLPTIHQLRDLEQREEKVEKVLREYAEKESKLAPVMRAAGLL